MTYLKVIFVKRKIILINIYFILEQKKARDKTSMEGVGKIEQGTPPIGVPSSQT